MKYEKIDEKEDYLYKEGYEGQNTHLNGITIQGNMIKICRKNNVKGFITYISAGVGIKYGHDEFTEKQIKKFKLDMKSYLKSINMNIEFHEGTTTYNTYKYMHIYAKDYIDGNVYEKEEKEK